MNRLRQFIHYLNKVFDLGRLLGTVRDTRCYPEIPTSVVTFSLFLGAALREGSLLAIEHRSRRPGWRRLVGATQPLTDDTLAYVLARYRLEWSMTIILHFSDN